MGNFIVWNLGENHMIVYTIPTIMSYGPTCRFHVGAPCQLTDYDMTFLHKALLTSYLRSYTSHAGQKVPSLNLIFHNQHQRQLVYQAINSKRESINDVDGLHVYARTTYVAPAQIECGVLFALGRFLIA
jgi:hypothetical protein